MLKLLKPSYVAGLLAAAVLAVVVAGSGAETTSAASAGLQDSNSGDADSEARKCHRVVVYSVEGATHKKKPDREQRIVLRSCAVGEDKKWDVAWVGHSKKRKTATVDETAYPLPKPGKVSRYWKERAKDSSDVSKKKKKGDKRYRVDTNEVIAHLRDGNYLAGKYEYPDWALVLISEGHDIFCDFKDGFSCTTDPDRLVRYYQENEESTYQDLASLGRDYLEERDALLDVVAKRMLQVKFDNPSPTADEVNRMKAIILALAPATAPDPSED